MAAKKKTWRAESKTCFPDLKPTRAGSFTQTDDGLGVLVSCFDQPVVLVLHHATDLHRLRGMIDAAIRTRDAKKKR